MDSDPLRSHGKTSEPAPTRLLIIDFSGREQFPPAVIAPLLEGGGQIHVLRTNPVGVRSFLKDMVRSSGVRFRERAALWLFGVAGEAADTTLRRDLRIGRHWRIRHIRPSPWFMLRSAVAALLSPATWRAASAMRRGRFTRLMVGNVDVSGYVSDSIIRWGRPIIVFTLPRFLALPYTALGVATCIALGRFAERLAGRFRFTDVLINHTVYAESGMIARILQARIGQQLRTHLANDMQTELLRISRLPCCAYTVLTRDAMQRSIGPGVIRTLPEWYITDTITHAIGRQPRRKGRHVMLAMHCLCDACDVYSDRDATYPSYFAWLEESVEIAREYPSLSLLLRRHPAHAMYGANEEALSQYLFRKGPPNCRVLRPGLDDVRKYIAESVVVTFKGSIALELACTGKRVVTLAEANCPEACYLRIPSAQEYRAFLRGGYVDFDDSLRPQEVELAERYRAAYYQVLQRSVSAREA